MLMLNDQEAMLLREENSIDIKSFKKNVSQRTCIATLNIQLFGVISLIHSALCHFLKLSTSIYELP